MDDLVTVIVPVYNVRSYLERCVNSIISQTYTALQIILVDDGSLDGSGDICDELAHSDMRIEVIHRANGGLSAARNTGLDHARGAWISFVDSDDYVSRYYIEDMLTAAMRNGCDLAVSRYVSVREDSDERVFTRAMADIRCLTGREACIYHFGKGAEMLNTSCGKLFRARLWARLRYPEGKINEDLFVSHELLYSAERVAIINAALYAYVQTSGSIMRGVFTTRRVDMIDAWWEGVRLFSAAGEADLAHIARRVYSSRVFDARCICKRMIPHERDVLRLLRKRAIEAYIDAKPIRGYVDCSWKKALAYRIKLLLGRWCQPVYAMLFIRGREYI